MKEEVIACIRKDDLKYLQSGQISKHIFPMDRQKAHDKKIPHLIVRVFIIRKKYNSEKDSKEFEYLVQKRSKNKSTYPGYYTDSASGHVLFKENLNLKDIKGNAIRELEEEFGIKNRNLKSLSFYEISSEENEITIEIAYIFIGFAKNNVQIKPNPNEVDPTASKFYSKENLSQILNNEKLVDHSKQIWENLLDKRIIYKFNRDKSFDKKENHNRTALFIGRFQPLHHGHIHVIYRIYENYTNLKIGIGSSQFSNTKSNPFSSVERKEFIHSAMEKRNIPPKKYQIYEIPDIFNAKKWVENVVNIVGDFHIVYSNSDWVRELFQNKNYNVAKKITIFRNKYNGTHIRKLITQQNEEWVKLVPNEVALLIQKFNGIERIKTLYKDD